MKKLVVLLVLALCSLSLIAQPPYGESLQRRRTLLKVLPVNSRDIVFLGNSITHGGEWAELFNNKHVKNRGIGGDRAEWLFDRVDYLIAGKPKKLFLMIGINDLSSGRTPEAVLADIKRLVEMFGEGSPKTKIYIQSVLPINEIQRPSYSHLPPHIITVNDGLRQICAEKGLTYIDLHPVLSDGEGRLNADYSFDGLHLTGEGYLRWTEAVKGYVK